MAVQQVSEARPERLKMAEGRTSIQTSQVDFSLVSVGLSTLEAVELKPAKELARALNLKHF